MKIKYLIPGVIAATAIALSQSTTSAQAAALGGGGLNGPATCDKVDNNYFIDCAGWFDGNDKGAMGTGETNLNTFFSGTWAFAGDSDSGAGSVVKFGTGGDGDQTGTATTNLSGFGAIAVKAGNSYSLYTVSDLASFNWSTEGVKPVGNKGNTPGLSHLSVYKRITDPEDPKPVPEPSVLLSLVGIASIGTRLKRNKR